MGFTFWVATCGATSMIRGLSMILAVRLPFSTIPIIHAWWPSPYLGDLISAQNRAACSRGKQMRRPPGKATERERKDHRLLGCPVGGFWAAGFPGHTHPHCQLATNPFLSLSESPFSVNRLSADDTVEQCAASWRTAYSIRGTHAVSLKLWKWPRESLNIVHEGGVWGLSNTRGSYFLLPTRKVLKTERELFFFDLIFYVDSSFYKKDFLYFFF